MSDSPSIPPPPLVPVVVPETTEAKLRAWKKHIRTISPRIRLVDPSQKELFASWYTIAQQKMAEILAGTDYTVDGFPTKEDIAFFVAVKASHDSTTKQFNTGMFWIFSVGNIAFSLSYFEWDGDADAGDWAETYSLRGYSSDALSWEYVLSCIVSRIEDIENKIPNLPIKFRRRRKKKKKKMS